MLIDFCHHCLGSKIKTDKVSFDGYEVTNLLSSDLSLKNKGFLSDHFIKPPVNVIVQFPCNIVIYRIVVDPVIGRQQSCDIKLFTGTRTITKSWLYGGDDNLPVSSDGLLLNNVGYIASKEPQVVCFQNSSFRERNLWMIDNLLDSYQFPIRAELRGRKPGSLGNVSHLNICISKVRNGGSVAIKRLEVWGMPSSTVPLAIQRTLLDVYTRTTHPNDEKHVSPSVTLGETCFPSLENTGSDVQDVNYVVEDGVEIPEDFIDQITYDVMAIPMILPCGKCVDKSTIERFVNTEASWGRAPSDPFTRVLFTPAHQVIPNVALKARIDQFVLKNAHKLKVARTLGRPESSRADSKAKKSRLVYDESQLEGNKTNNSSNDNYNTTTGISDSVGSVKRTIHKVDTLNKAAHIGNSIVAQYDSLKGPNRKRKREDRTQVINSSSPQSDNLVQLRNTCTSIMNRTTDLGACESLQIAKLSPNAPRMSQTQESLVHSECNTGNIIQKRSKLNFESHQENRHKNSGAVGSSKSKTELSFLHASHFSQSHLTDGSVRNVKHEEKAANHVSKLSSSLDSALSDVLGNLPSFTSSGAVKETVSELSRKLACSFCDMDLESDSVIKYHQPCSHYTCRNCAQKVQTMKIATCKLCRVTFTSDDLTRVFNT